MQLDKNHFQNTVLETPFHTRTAAFNQVNDWHRWMDYTTATAYFDVALEYFAIRNACSVFDLTPMSKYRIEGPDALSYLDRLLTRNAAKIKPGRVVYTVWCDDRGQVIDDGTIFHIEPGRYRLCSQERQLDWLMLSAIGFDVEIVDETHEVAALALQGPTSCAALTALGLEGIENLKPFAITHFPFGGQQLMVSRTGFTGDLGYELWIAPELGEKLWDGLFEAGRPYGIMPIGTSALDIVRIEAGFIQAGVDFLAANQCIRPGRTRSPYELGLGWLVDLGKHNFTGRAALAAEKQRGSRYSLVKLDIAGNKPAKDAFVYNRRRQVVGTVTSAVWSPSAKANIALASLRRPWGRARDRLAAEIYYQRELQWTRIMLPARVVDGVFFDPPRRKQTPAGPF